MGLQSPRQYDAKYTPLDLLRNDALLANIDTIQEFSDTSG